MSGFEFRGRSVADSKPVVHGAALNRDANGMADLQSAWGSMGYAKSMLRRAEHNLHEAEKPAVLLNGSEKVKAGQDFTIDRTTGQDYSVMVDRIPSYRITDSGGGTRAMVDNFGRTSYMKAKVASARKVCRMEDKYVDRHPGYEEPRRRSPLREPNHQELTSAHTEHMRSHRSKHSDHPVAGLKHSDHPMAGLKHSDHPMAGLAHSKYSDHPVAGLPHSKYLDREALASYDNLPAKDYSSYITQRSSSSSVNNGYHHSVDVTDPQAVRDTHIQFLNDNINNPSKAWGTSASARVTHVGVRVPGASGMPHHIPGSMPHNAVPSHTMPPHAMPHHAMPPRRSATNGHALTASGVAVPGGTNTTYTVPCGDSSGLGKKLRKNLKSADRDTGGLAKLREKILLQRKKTLSQQDVDIENVCIDRGADRGVDRGVDTLALARVHHQPDDPVTPNRTADPRPPVRTVVATRKIASAPPPPTYKGFSETEIRFKTPDGKVVRATERVVRGVDKKPKKGKPATKVHRHPEAKGEDKLSEKTVRIVAEKKKASRYERKDIITTRSWRVGQQLILRELGPSKVAKLGTGAPHSPPTHDREDSQDAADDDIDREESRKTKEVTGVPKKDATPATPVDGTTREAEVLQKMLRMTEEERKMEAPLSRTAKSVLEDLFSDKSDSEDDEKKGSDVLPTRTPVKRKRPKSHEHEKEERNLPKVRHYDSDEVRKYIARQRADRKKKLEEDEKARNDATANRRRQLEELYRKQKETAKLPVAGGKARVEDRQGDMDRREAERDAAMWSDLSDLDSVTLHDVSADIRHRSTTRDVEFVKKPAASGVGEVKVTRPNIDEMIEHYATQTSDAARDVGAKQLTASEILQQYTQLTGLNVDDVVNEYTHRVAAPHHQAPGGYAKQPVSSLPVHLYPTAPQGGSTGPAFRTRAERIQAIKDAATALKTRLNSEVQKMSHDLAGDPIGEVTWAQPRSSELNSRYDRIAGTTTDYNVFTTDLPGVMSVAKETNQAEGGENEAATKIQAAYRGHTVRQYTRTEPGHKTSSRRHKHSKMDVAAALSDDSISSGDSTLTNEPVFSSYPAVPFRQATLGQRDFCASVQPYSSPMVPASHKYPDSLPSKQVLTWNKDIPDPDPFSVINILARRQLHRVKAEKLRRERGESATDAQGHTKSIDHATHSVRSHVTSDQSKLVAGDRSDRRSQSRSDRNPPSSRSRSARTLDDISTSYKDDFTAASTTSALSPEGASGASHYAPSRSRGKIARHSSPDKTITSDGDNTLEATLTPSDDSDDQETSVRKSRTSKAVTDRETAQSLTVSSHVTSHDQSDASDLSSLGGEDRSIDEGRPQVEGTQHRGYVAMQMSPAALEHRHAVELHLLDSMEVSMRQLTDVDRMRVMTLAQQETVSLAQILKGRQQAHDHQVAEMQLRSQQGALVKERKLEAAQQRATEAARNMAADDRRTQDDVLTSLRGAASKLLATQSEAARVTADAAHQLTQAKLALVQPAASPWQPAQSGHQVAAPEPAHTVERGTEYSIQAASLSATDESYTTSDGFESFSETSSPKHKSAGSTKHSSRQQSDSERRLATATPVGDASIPTASGATASDTSNDTASTIHTEHGDTSGGEMSPRSQSVASVTEAVPSAGKADRSLNLDTSNAVDEMESSMREVMPSEGQRKKLKKEGSSHLDECSFSSADDFHVPSLSSSRRLSFEEDSFTKFTIDMMKQYMQEEEIRAQHQRSLLKLRERALKEKTRAELAWLEQQKQRHRDKGADEIYPQIKKRERALVLKLRQEKDKIKRMQEANRVASKERQMLLEQSQEIARLRQSTHKVCEKLQTGKTNVPEEGMTEDELSTHLDDDSESSPNKGSGSERGRGSSPPTDPLVMQKLKKLRLDEKYLTKREQILCRRRKNAEKLMEWKRRLDEEEATVERMEKEVLVRMDTGGKDETGKGRSARVKAPHIESITTESVVKRPSELTLSPRQPKGSLSARTITEEITTATSCRSDEICSRTPSPGRRTQESGNESGDKSVIEEYANETFESSPTEIVASETATPRTVSQKTPSPASSPLHSRLSKLTRDKRMTLPSTRSPILTAVSVSESEDSFPLPPSETASEQSDVEGRIRALNDDLARRKREAERLKKQQRKEEKKQEHNKLKQQEQALKEQIEVYDSYIATLTTKKPQVAPPGVAKEQERPRVSTDSSSSKSSDGTAQGYQITSPRHKALLSSRSSDTLTPDVSVSHDGSGDSSSVSKKTSTVEQRLGGSVTPSLLTPGGDKSVEIREEISVVASEVTSEIELNIQLDDVCDGSERITPRFGLTDVHTMPRSESKGIPNSARSLSEIAEDYSVSIHTEISSKVASAIVEPPSDTDKPSTPHVTVPEVNDKEVKDRGHSESGSSAAATDESRSERSEKSARSSASKTTTYSQDFSSNATESGSRSRTEERSTEEQRSKDEESIKTEEDISEDLSVGDESDDSSEKLILELNDAGIDTTQKDVIQTDGLDHLEEGKRVVVGGVKCGVLRFKGTVQFAPGLWAGVELDEPEGTNDGTKEGVAYFSCRAGHGLFVPPDKIKQHRLNVEESSGFVVTSVGEEIGTDIISGSERKGETLLVDAQTPSVDDELIIDDVSVTTVDSELDRVISSADAGVMAFDVESLDMSAEVQHVLQQDTTVDENNTQVIEVVDKREVDIIAHTLLTDAISDILNIRKQKLDSFNPMDDAVVSSPESSEVLAASVARESDDRLVSQFERPGTPMGHAVDEESLNRQDELDKLYLEMESLTGEDDGWMDDDFGLSVKAHKPPPPYPREEGQDEPGVLSRPDLRLDLHKLTAEVFYAVPHSLTSVTDLSQRAVDVFWLKRRCGEPWADVTPPDTFYGSQDDSDVDTRSTRVYKKLVFDLTAEILCEMYADEDAVVVPSRGGKSSSSLQRRYFKEKNPPRTVDVLKPIIERHVADNLGLGKVVSVQVNKWGGRRKKDHVDQLLVQELRSEEPDWLDYDDDELAVKVQIADMIFESLLRETAVVVGAVHGRKLGVTGS